MKISSKFLAISAFSVSLILLNSSTASAETFTAPTIERVTTFVGYLNKHRQRIVNYGYFQAEGISIGSGAIESTVKQIGRRIKISGAQWEKDNVPQVLKQRCAYLNGQFSK